MAQRRSRPTLRQVADAAGVSVMTASYVYSQPGRVAPETAAKVRAAADRLDYPGPHPGARSLRRGSCLAPLSQLGPIPTWRKPA